MVKGMSEFIEVSLERSSLVERINEQQSKHQKINAVFLFIIVQIYHSTTEELSFLIHPLIISLAVVVVVDLFLFYLP